MRQAELPPMEKKNSYITCSIDIWCAQSWLGGAHRSLNFLF